MNSLVEENYLKALFVLSSESDGVSVNVLSKHLSIKMPTVTSMMKKLAAKNLVHYEIYKPIRLSGEGRKQAALIIRKHRLTEMFLVERMGFAWDEVHEIAEQVEHIQSPAFFAKMDELLGFPTQDPHGSPIPYPDGGLPKLSTVKLSECALGEKVTISAVINENDDFLKFLTSREIALGTEIYIEEKEAFDQSLVVRYNQRRETLSALVTERLLVVKR